MANGKNRLGIWIIFERNYSLSDSDALLQRRPRTLVTHIGTVCHVVGYEVAAQDATKKGGLVTGPSRGLENCLIGTRKTVKFIRDRLNAAFHEIARSATSLPAAPCTL
jgi:hypothetical protein